MCIHCVRFPGLSVQWAQEGSGQLSEGATDHSAFGLYVQLNCRPRVLNGMILDPNAIVVLPPGAEFCFSCDHANSWLAIRVPVELLSDSSDASHNRLLNAVSVIRPDGGLANKLCTTVQTYLQMSDRAPSLAQSVIAVSSFENEILAIARKVCFGVAGIESHSEMSSSARSQRHSRIAKAAAEIIEASLNAPVSVAAIAESLGVSERTLLTAFRSRFEMPPRRFMQSMRLNRARTRLLEANYPETLVQDIAIECGFWDVGRFAAKYQRLFGELPTETVKNGRAS